MLSAITSLGPSLYRASLRPAGSNRAIPGADAGTGGQDLATPGVAAPDGAAASAAVVSISKEGRHLQAAILGQKRSDDTNPPILGEKREGDQAPQSALGRTLSANGSSESSGFSESKGPAKGSAPASKPASKPAAKSVAQQPPPDQQRQVQQLRQRDAEVHAHEQAHATAGGAYAGMPSYSYTTGPDGHRYATGGETPIDSSPVRGNPQATVIKMEVVKAAALAPAQPSGQDMAVYSMANRIEQDAQAQERVRQFQAAHPSGGGRAAQSLAANPDPSAGASPYIPSAATVPTTSQAAAPSTSSPSAPSASSAPSPLAPSTTPTIAVPAISSFSA